MIIWISGPYGVGKSTLAEALKSRLENALIFDAEEVGNAVRGNYPDVPYGWIFEDYPLWAVFCYELLKDIHTKFGRDIIVPMTLLRESSRAGIIQRLEDDGIEVHFIILEASRRSVHDRILARGEDEDCWCMRNLDMARELSRAVSGGLHIDTEGKSVEETADAVLALLSGSF